MTESSTLVVLIGIVGMLVGLIPIPGTGLVYGLLLVTAGVVLRWLGH